MNKADIIPSRVEHDLDLPCALPASAPQAQLEPAETLIIRRQLSAALIVLWCCAGLALWRAEINWGNALPAPAATTKVNPNEAPWWELSLLPELGDSLAREIVRFRTAAAANAQEAGSDFGIQEADLMAPPVFIRAADLEQIRGIGPKTIQRIAPHLRFPQNGSADFRVANSD